MTTTRGKALWQDRSDLDQVARAFEDRRIRQEVGAEVFNLMFGALEQRPEDLTVPELLRLLADRLEMTWPPRMKS